MIDLRYPLLYTEFVQSVLRLKISRGKRMATGTVKWFSNQKGYGFIEYDEEEEVFVHFTGIEMEGYKTLKEGQTVEFDIAEGARGPQATNVSVLDSEHDEE